MPTYDFKCTNCGHTEELLLPVNKRDEVQFCSKCKSITQRIPAFGSMQWSKWGGDDYLKYRWPQKPKRNYFTGHSTKWAEGGE